MLWSKYKDLFITEQRIKDGIKFWQDNLKVLERAEQTYHVPAEVIVAILGIETMMFFHHFFNEILRHFKICSWHFFPF
jgi:membrane-bound lytic murein transglycosylase B